MDTRVNFAQKGLVAAIAAAAVLIAVQAASAQQGSSALDQLIAAAGQSAADTACPSTATGGCSVTGITSPNGLDVCQGTGTNVHNNATQADLTADLQLWTTQLCNTQPIDPATWVYGPSNDLTLAQQLAPFWNPVIDSMTRGLAIAGARWADVYGADYCTTATYAPTTNDFNWADEMHSGLDNSGIWLEWGTTNESVSGVAVSPPTIPEPSGVSQNTPNYPSLTTPMNCGLTATTIAQRGAFGSSLDEREAQHDADGGADVIIRPVTSTRDAQEAVFWSFWPPFGHRSQGFSTSQYNGVITANADGQYRQSYNMNLVLMALIQTVSGADDANGIAALDGIDALVIDMQDLTAQAANATQYTNAVNKITKAATNNRKYLCMLDWSATPAKISCTGPAPEFGGYWPNRRLNSDGLPVGSPKSFASLGNKE